MNTANVLVVEDNKAHAELIGLAFQPDSDFRLRLALCLEEARAAIAEHAPELVITDLLLPDGRGTDLLLQDSPAFPVVVMTGHGDEAVAVEAMKAGAVNYLVKCPKTLADLPRIASSTLREWDHIVERRRAEAALMASERRFRTLFDNNPSMFFTVDEGGTVVSVNRFAAEQLGREDGEMVGRQLADLHAETERPNVERYLKTCFEEPESLHRWQTCHVRGDGRLIWVNVTARVMEDPATDPMALIVCEDVTEARKLSDRLVYHASHDPLTGLANRRKFGQRLQKALHSAKSRQAEHALCYLDLDQFKVINDTCGHVAGDELLRQISSLLKQKVRKCDILARLGGDEFGIVLEDCSIANSLGVAKTLRQAVASYRFLWDDQSFTIGVSIGLVPIHESSGDASTLLAAADAACYAAKDQGRNRIHLYHEDDAELTKRHGEMQWVSRIHRALEHDLFRLVFQPILPLSNKTDEGEYFELLIRMEDEERKDILPGAFLAAAERYDLIQNIDRWVIDATFEWFSEHPADLARLAMCSINLSGRSVGDREFRNFIVRRLEETGFPAERLCFEITETVAISNLSLASQFMGELRALGCRFALDDFGRGLSSFGYLKNLPVDFIKIDGMFVKDMVDEPMDLVLVRAIQEIARVTGKKTIAEYVENDRILKKLEELGIDFAQGYYVGPPRPLEGLRSARARTMILELGRSPQGDDGRAISEGGPGVNGSSAEDPTGVRRRPLQVGVLPAALEPGFESVDFDSATGDKPGVGRDARPYRILQVDDDPVVQLATKAALEQAGFEVWTASSGRIALKILRERGLPHLALVDIFMPEMGGIELCEKFQAFVDLPIVMLTSVDDTDTEVEAINRVAEDYVTKPFEQAVLVARVERLLRRIGDFAYALEPRIRVDQRFEVEFGRRLAHVEGQAVGLTRIECKLLHILMGNAGHTVTTDFLLRRVWPQKEIFENVLRTHISRLRSKIEVDPHRPRYVVTKRDFGYSFKKPEVQG